VYGPTSDPERRCRHCGQVIPPGQGHLHHIAPKALGGSNDPSNLILLCERCHSRLFISSQSTIAGGIGGAILGSAFGPVGTVVGGIAGLVIGSTSSSRSHQ
jgi:hypothetical protein